MVLDRLLRCRAVSPVMVDQQVGGDRHQPGAGAGAIGVEAAPGAQGALEGELGQVLGIGARAHPVAEEPVDPPDVLLVELRDLLPRGAPRSPAASGGSCRPALVPPCHGGRYYRYFSYTPARHWLGPGAGHRDEDGSEWRREQSVATTGAASRSGDEPDTRRIMAGLFRRAPLIVACTLLTAGAALVFSLLQTKQYTADASLLFRDPGFDQRIFGSSVAQAPDPTREAATNITLVSLEAVADRTAAALGGGLTGDEISNKVSVQSEGQSDVASIQATDPEPAVRRDPGQRLRRELHRLPAGRRSQEGPAGAQPGRGRLRTTIAGRPAEQRRTVAPEADQPAVDTRSAPDRQRRAGPARDRPHLALVPEDRPEHDPGAGSSACSSGSAWRLCSSVTTAGCASRRNSRRPSACRC